MDYEWIRFSKNGQRNKKENRNGDIRMLWVPFDMILFRNETTRTKPIPSLRFSKYFVFLSPPFLSIRTRHHTPVH